MEQIQEKEIVVKTGRKYSFGFWLGLLFAAIIIDQITKWIAQSQHWPIFHNDNFAFSVPVPATIMFSIYSIVMGLVILYLKKIWNEISFAQRLGWILIIAGGTANITERIMLGYVRDFIFIANGVFNFADMYIFLGVIIVLITGRERK